MVFLKHAPKMVYNDTGRLVEVIVSAEDFQAYLHAIMAEEDWETLPTHLQDAIDRMLIDKVRGEKDTACDLNTVLADDESGT